MNLLGIHLTRKTIYPTFPISQNIFAVLVFFTNEFKKLGQKRYDWEPVVISFTPDVLRLHPSIYLFFPLCFLCGCSQSYHLLVVSFPSLPFLLFFGLRWAGQVAFGLVLLPHSTHRVDTAVDTLGLCLSVCFFGPFFDQVVCGWSLWLGWWSGRGNGFVGSSPCEAAVVDSPLRRQLSGNLALQCHKQALAERLHGVGFCPSMEVGRGSVCDLEEDRLG